MSDAGGFWGAKPARRLDCTRGAAPHSLPLSDRPLAGPDGAHVAVAPTPKPLFSSLSQEFKNFAFKGNVVDLAVGVIIGAQFGKIVTSLVENVIMPLLGAVMPGDQSYKDWKLPIGDGVPVGLFLADVVSFVILAAALFLFIVKFLGWLMKSKAAGATEAAPEPSKEEKLLTEIRDLLKARA